jgi:hypothetical protein
MHANTKNELQRNGFGNRNEYAGSAASWMLAQGFDLRSSLLICVHLRSNFLWLVRVKKPAA